MQNRIIFSALLVLAATPAMAGPREDMMAGIARCGGIADDRNFLNCVYGAAQPLRARLGLPPAPDAQVRLVPPAAAPVPVPQVIASAPPRPAAAPIPGPEMRDRLESFAFDRRGLFNIMLGNGEMYRQEPNDVPRAQWLGRASDYVVRVIKEPSGAAQMRVMGDPNLYRMRRVN